jgi:hypothetical protein
MMHEAPGFVMYTGQDFSAARTGRNCRQSWQNPILIYPIPRQRRPGLERRAGQITGTVVAFKSP